jgi:flagellar M-ring protein FliF
VRPSGQVKRIAAALLVDDVVQIAEKDGRRVEVRQKRTPDQLKQIEELSKAAIGLDSNRGDLLNLQNISFEAAQAEEISKPGISERVRTVQNEWASSIRIGAVLLLFLLVYFVMLRPVKKQILTSMKAVAVHKPSAPIDLHRQEAAAAIERPEAPPELKKVGSLAKQLNEKVKAEPAASTRLVQTWIRDGGVE